MNYSLRTWTLVAAGVATACLVFANPFLGDLYYTVGLLFFAYGIIRAIFSQGHQRAFWIGFVVVFGIYSYHSAWAFLQFGGARSASTGLITTRLLSTAYEGMNPELSVARGRFTTSPSSTTLPGNLIGGYIAFLTMGHTLIALGLGIVGGQFAQRLAATGAQAALANYRSLEEILQEVDSPSID